MMHSSPPRATRSTSPEQGSVGNALEVAAASSLPPDEDADDDDALMHLQTLAEDLLRQVAERDVELEETKERHQAELNAAGSSVPWADPPWLRRQPDWLRALAFTIIMYFIVILPQH